MPGSDGSLIFDTKIDDAGFKKGLNGLGDTMNKFGTKLDNIAQNSGLSALNNQANQLGNTIKGVFAGNMLTDAVKAGIGKLADFAKSAIMAASDLEEVQNVVDVTFGENATAIQEFADSAMKAYGLTEMQTKQYTSTLGAMLKSLGIADKDVLSMSVDLTKLTGDMASFYNLDHDTAYQKIKAGLSGEAEPLKALGINLSSATLNAYALQQGLSKTYDKMSEAEKVNLRYMYIMEATADAQGDFSRTSEGFSNQLRILQGNIANLTAGIGEKLLPAATGALTAINSLFAGPETDPLLDEVQKIIDKLDEVPKHIAEIQAAYENDKTQNYIDYREGKIRVGAVYGAATDEERKFATEQLIDLFPEFKNYVDKKGNLTLTDEDAALSKLQQFYDDRLVMAQSNETASADQLVTDAVDAVNELADKAEEYYAEVEKVFGDWDTIEKARDALTGGGLAGDNAVNAFGNGEISFDQLLAAVQALSDAEGGIAGLAEKGVDTEELREFYDKYGENIAIGEENADDLVQLATDLAYYSELYTDEVSETAHTYNSSVGALKAECESAGASLREAMGFRSDMLKQYEENNGEKFKPGVSNKKANAAIERLQNAVYGEGDLTGEANAAQLEADFRRLTGTPISSKSIGAGEVIVEQVAEATAESVNAAAPSHGVKPGSLTHAATVIVGDVEQELVNSVNGTPGRPSAHATIGGSHATGLDRVPYDGYIARLHVGESVLNAADASAYRAGRSGGIDYDALGAAVASALPKNTGKTVLAIDGVELAQVQQRRNYDSMTEYDRRVQLGVGKR